MLPRVTPLFGTGTAVVGVADATNFTGDPVRQLVGIVTLANLSGSIAIIFTVDGQDITVPANSTGTAGVKLNVPPKFSQHIKPGSNITVRTLSGSADYLISAWEHLDA